MKHLRLLLLVPFTLVLALMPIAASAAPPEVNHFRDVGTDTDPDFCGTGQAVDITFDVRVNEWISANGPEDLVRTTVRPHRVYCDADCHVGSLGRGRTERLDVAAAVRVARRADAVRALRLAALRADVQAWRLDLVLRAALVAAGLRGFLLGDGHRSRGV